MSLNPPQTPVRVPKAASNYSPVTHDLDLRSQINTKLIRDGHVEKIQTALTHALHASSTNWPARIEAYALELLRAKECTTFPALLDRVVSEVRHDTLVVDGGVDGAENGHGDKASRSSEDVRSSKKRRTVHMAEMWEDELERSLGGEDDGEENGADENEEDMSLDEQRRKRKRKERAWRNGRQPHTLERDASESLAVPQNVIDEGVNVTRECLEHVCEIEDY